MTPPNLPSPPCQPFIDQLLAAPDPLTRLRSAAALLQDPTCAQAAAAAFKAQADHHLRTDLARAREWAKLLFELAALTGEQQHRALGLRALGNVLMIGEYRCEEAIQRYDEAAAIYQAAARPVETAQSQVGKVGALFFLGRYDEALTTGRAAQRTLTEEKQWLALTGLLLNMAAIHRRLGQGEQALLLLDDAETVCARSGADAELPGIALNRANVLCDLGQLRRSLQTGHRAENLFVERGQMIGAARAQMSQAIACFSLGRYNDALALFDRARRSYMSDERHSDAVLVERFVSDLLLQLGRFEAVIEKCQVVRARYNRHGIDYEVGQAILNEAVAYAGLGRPEQALASLADARALLAENEARAAVVDLEKAAILLQQGQWQESWQSAAACGRTFQTHHLRLRAAQAALIAARAAMQLDRRQEAHDLAQQALAEGEREEVAWLSHQAHHLLGNLARMQGRLPEALAEYQLAITQLERLRGRLMVELRAEFLANKQLVYEDAVVLQLELERPAQALETVEQAKSRALVELLAHRLDLRLVPRTTADKQLVADLQQLRRRRNQLYRRVEVDLDEETQAGVRTQIAGLEKQIADLWQTLLVRNAGYARDASWWRSHGEPIQPHLDDQTLLLEYFIAHGELILFLVTRNTIVTRRLPGVLNQLLLPSRLLNVNLKAVPHSTASQTAQLERGARKHTGQLYQLLIQPIRDIVSAYRHLIIVPHGALLHYLPFQALYDGRQFLIERHQVSYLPSASLGHYLPRRRDGSGPAVAFGYSHEGRLPFAAQEAATIAALLDGRAFLEEDATIAQLQRVASGASLLHLATHGDFNQVNPLFSGLRLADGQLNTLDIFHLRLRASLVTLSACQTGRSVVSGGDELLGLMRAFLYAGAASLLLGLWRVDDRATLDLMSLFYGQLAAGETKGAALRQAQLQFLHRPAENRFRHPYYWAPFFLVGQTGPLSND